MSSSSTPQLPGPPFPTWCCHLSQVSLNYQLGRRYRMPWFVPRFTCAIWSIKTKQYETKLVNLQTRREQATVELTLRPLYRVWNVVFFCWSTNFLQTSGNLMFLSHNMTKSILTNWGEGTAHGEEWWRTKGEQSRSHCIKWLWHKKRFHFNAFTFSQTSFKTLGIKFFFWNSALSWKYQCTFSRKLHLQQIKIFRCRVLRQSEAPSDLFS